ncbi:beta-tubulin cofactor d [Setomelanomma holmii]|uniref:Beta-tubulin cofactor d n=1 Tax=Setomelanomma holmii TaxID=210430 RepID=A0A9P4HDY7_9PLEO|nr:beta-tubulin cofactor d [Setomelanomma holmii]
MSAGEDDDVKLQRASASLIAEFGALLPRLLRKRKHDSVPVRLMWKACSLIEPFQEDPQILDTHLKTFLPPLVAAYLRTLNTVPVEHSTKGSVPLSHAICCTLNVFCKVRGEKVIKGFFNNEPRYLLSILDELEAGRNLPKVDNDTLQQQLLVPWAERYILLSWLSHLMLAPFPLESISGLEPSQQTATRLGLQLTPSVPGIALRVLAVCFQRLESASKERPAAANLLVRLCTRPDMQKLGMVDSLVKWSVSFFDKAVESQTDIHASLGVLSFLSGLVASTTTSEIGPHLSTIYRTCRGILDQESLSFVKSSAVARKLIVKMLHNIITHCLQPASNLAEIDATSTLEEVIEYLLEAVADGDTPVRYGVSKALSIITLKLDMEMAEEVVEAILGSLNENVYWQGSKRNLSGVNPLRWHGLTLTLAQLLYRKAISTRMLPNVLNALLLSLGFEQRSPTGGSIGTNVRDAACFGVWALSRRYATDDLLEVETGSIRACEHRKDLSVTQALAIELVAVACLDPAGNIRRGSSAALQELIGRHPNTIENGISLVQVVDFHAVGLRQRALCNVALKASDLHALYWEALFEGLLGWRGTGSLDTDSRLFAARAVGLLSHTQSADGMRWMSDQIRDQLVELRTREVEERQGLVSSLAALATAATDSLNDTSGHCKKADRVALLKLLSHLWQLLGAELMLDDKAFTSPALRPEHTASSILCFIAAMSRLTIGLPESDWPSDIPIAEISRVLNLCLARHEEPVLDAIILTVPTVLPIFKSSRDGLNENLVNGWLSSLSNEASFNGLRCSGHAVAIGAAYSTLICRDLDGQAEMNASDLLTRIVRVLTFRCTAAVAIEARIVALRALNVLVRSSRHLSLPTESQVAAALHIALNDYTITERGDIGSLVRTEALRTVGSSWTAGALQTPTSESLHFLGADVLRLSLEKLDKIRVVAAQVLRLRDVAPSGEVHTVNEDVSSVSYFLGALQKLRSTNNPTIQQVICLGVVNSAGMASESVAQNARDAIVTFTADLPVHSADGKEWSLLDFANCVLGILKANNDNDRVLVPLLETVAFLFDMQIMHHLTPTSFNFRSLLSLIQKAHFKSTHMQKLHLAIEVYRGLGCLPNTRQDTLSKVTSMLLHPFPKIRMMAAETLWILTRVDALKLQDWSVPSKTLKPFVLSLQKELIVAASA